MGKTGVAIGIVGLIALAIVGVGAIILTIKGHSGPENGSEDKVSNESSDAEVTSIGEVYIKVNGATLKVKLADNSSAEALAEKLKNGDTKVRASDYGGFEKVGNLGFVLPTNDENITTEPGDLILYRGDKVTLYYDTNSWSFTRLGRVQDVSPKELREILGDGEVELVLSLNN